MNETVLNARLVRTRPKRVFYHLRSVDCERSDLWKSFGWWWKEWPAWFCCLLDLSSGVMSSVATVLLRKSTRFHDEKH